MWQHNLNPSLTLQVAWRALLLAHVLLVLTSRPANASTQGPNSPTLQPSNTPTLQHPIVHLTASNTFQIGHVELDKARRTVSIPARVRLRNEVVEYALVTEQGKAYESMLTTDARPSDIHVAFLLLGVNAVDLPDQPGKPMPVPKTNALTIEVTWTNNGQSARFALSELVSLTSGGAEPKAPSMNIKSWLYNGSIMNPRGFAAQVEGSIISLIRDPSALINNPGSDRDNDNIHFPNASLLPTEGTPVRLIITLPARPKGL